MVEDDDRNKKYGRFAQTEQSMRRVFSDPNMGQQRSYRSKQQDFSAKKNTNPDRRESLANGVRESSPAQLSPSRASRASKVSRSSNKKPTVATIRLNSGYDPEQYYEGGYGEEQDESEEDPEQYRDYRNSRQMERNQRVEEMRVFRSP